MADKGMTIRVRKGGSRTVEPPGKKDAGSARKRPPAGEKEK